MKNLNILLSFLILFSFCWTCFSQIVSVSFLPLSNIVSNETPQRDGIVLVTLNTTEVTTICNYNFNEINAGIVCKTLGFPNEGVSIINNAKTNLNTPVLLANFNCSGSESNLTNCVNSGRIVQVAPCSNHIMDVHVYCLQKKVVPVIVLNTLTVCNKTSPTYSLINKGTLQNSGLLQVNINGNPHMVCNDDYSFSDIAAEYVCNQLCFNPNNPVVIMPYSTNNETSSTKIICSSNSNCNIQGASSCFKPSFYIGLRCGDEPQIREKAPNISCTDQNMTLTWEKDFEPYINSSLISLETCNNVIKNDSSVGTSMLIPFNNCTPAISGDSKNVIFTYTVKREYLFNSTVKMLPKTITFSCSFPKSDKPNNTFGFSGVTKSPLNANMTLRVGMNFYSDSRLTTEVLANGQINNDVLLYVKVYIINPPKNVSLHLIDCSVATVNDTNLLSNGNSVSLIKDSCPNSIYDVIISPISRTEVKFQFSPFKTLSTPSTLLYVHCKTSLCYLIRDPDCPVCSNRKKRSTNLYLKDFDVSRSFYLR